MSLEALGLLAVIVILAVSAIICAELYDRRDEKRQKRAMDAGIRCSGRIRCIERKGILDWRNAYHWRVEIAFEFEGERYSIEHHCMAKPMRAVGELVVVFADRDDPWKSKAAL